MKNDQNRDAAVPVKTCAAGMSSSTVARRTMSMQMKSSPSIALKADHPDARVIRTFRRLGQMKQRENELFDEATRLAKEAERSVPLPEALNVRKTDKYFVCRLVKFCGADPTRVSNPRSFRHSKIDVQKFRDSAKISSRMSSRCDEILDAIEDYNRALDYYDNVNGWIGCDEEFESYSARVATRMRAPARLRAVTLDGVKAKIASLAHFSEVVLDMEAGCEGGIDGIIYSIIHDLLDMRRIETINESVCKTKSARKLSAGLGLRFEKKKSNVCAPALS